jgi:glutathione S-transferase
MRMKLYLHPSSPASQKVRLVLAEKSLDFEARHVDLPNKENLEPWYLRLNRLGVLPTLVDGDTPINESSVICSYVEDAYPEPRLSPPDPKTKARMRWWMSVVDDRLHTSCGALVWPLLMRPALLEKSTEERERLLFNIPDRSRQERHRRWVEYGVESPDFRNAVLTYRETLDAMNSDLANGPWLAGDMFSLADCALIPYVQAIHQFNWEGLFDRHPLVADWFERGKSRNSFAAAISSQLPLDALERIKKAGMSYRDKVIGQLRAAAN